MQSKQRRAVLREERVDANARKAALQMARRDARRQQQQQQQQQHRRQEREPEPDGGHSEYKEEPVFEFRAQPRPQQRRRPHADVLGDVSGDVEEAEERPQRRRRQQEPEESEESEESEDERDCRPADRAPGTQTQERRNADARRQRELRMRRRDDATLAAAHAAAVETRRQQAAARRRAARQRTINARRDHGGTVRCAARHPLDSLREDDATYAYYDCGLMTSRCGDCGALYWPPEANKDGTYTRCCHRGTTVLPPIPRLPREVAALFHGATAKSKQFLDNIRSYNGALNFASMKMTDERLFRRGTTGSRCPVSALRISGAVQHFIGPLRPAAGREPACAQVYLLDPEAQLDHRCRRENIDRETMRILQDCILNHNRFYNLFRQIDETLQDTTVPDARIVFHAEERRPGVHERRANAPTTDEVAFVMSGDPGKAAEARDIVVHYRRDQGSGLRVIKNTHRHRDPLHYTVLFPTGGPDGWSIGIYQRDGVTKLTEMRFYTYRLHVRSNATSPERHVFSPLHRAKKLFHEYGLDGYLKIETSRLEYQRNHQKELRADLYHGLEDAVSNGNEAQAGKFVLLASSFQGGPREMRAAYQDSMAIVREYGKPDFFVTFTCNPNWPEIRKELYPGQEPKDRPDLICRVFHMKLKELLKDFHENHVLGKLAAYTYSIEYQKRGLPHAHILLILERGCKVPPEELDKYVCAEIPDPDTQPRLHNIVTTNLLHGPCGHHNRAAPCMKDGECSKNFPKDFLNDSQIPDDGYALYRRRSPEEGGRTFTKRIGDHDFVFDNRWVVPYNPYLCLKFDAHINIEFCASVRSVKYIHKYVYKGHDEATISIASPAARDEIDEYVNGRYVCSTEAVWRTLGFECHGHYPPVQRLACHLENGQRVVWEDSDDPEERAERARIAAAVPPTTTLTAWFAVNRRYEARFGNGADVPFTNATLARGERDSRDFFYHEMPKYFNYSTDPRTETNAWLPRKQGDTRRRARLGLPGDDFSSDKVARVYAVSPKDREAFYCRMLLSHVKGATSFADLRRFNGVLHPYVGACRARGLLQGDDEWDACIVEAQRTQSASSLRQLFATICTHCEPSDPLNLWNTHKVSFCEDILHRHRTLRGNSALAFDDRVENEGLLEVEALLDAAGFTMTSFNLPQPEHVARVTCRQVADELRFADTQEKQRQLMRQCLDNVRSMKDKNPDQFAIFEEILSDVNNKRGGVYFIDAPAGTGKTFLSTTLLAEVRRHKKTALAVASSGIAATLLPGGRTAHSRFKIPLDPDDSSMCNITQRTDDQTRAVIEQAAFLLWDEVPMTNKLCFEALDRTLRRVLEVNEPFGGKVVIFLGDFRQCLPVVKRGRRFQIVDAALKKSRSVWQHVKVRSLTKNMRVELSGGEDRDELRRFAEFLLHVGDGVLPTVSDLGIDWVKIDDHLRCVEAPDDLIHEVYGELDTHYQDADWLFKRAILSPRNAVVDSINERMTDAFPGTDTVEVLSADEVGTDDDAALFPIEFLNSLAINGMPPHKLALKVGIPVMLLRNLDPGNGDCNGSRYIVQSITPRLLELARWVDGEKKTLLVPRVRLTTKEGDLPFTLTRRQFPVRPAFAMSINKSQGQSLKKVGLLLPKPVFSHGQLYVALSRVGKPGDIVLHVTNTPDIAEYARRHPGVYTRNVVYREVLQDS